MALEGRFPLKLFYEFVSYIIIGVFKLQLFAVRDV